MNDEQKPADVMAPTTYLDWVRGPAHEQIALVVYAKRWMVWLYAAIVLLVMAGSVASQYAPKQKPAIEVCTVAGTPSNPTVNCLDRRPAGP